jgi:lipoprotein signal peptidase
MPEINKAVAAASSDIVFSAFILLLLFYLRLKFAATAHATGAASLISGITGNKKDALAEEFLIGTLDVILPVCEILS